MEENRKLTALMLVITLFLGLAAVSVSASPVYLTDYLTGKGFLFTLPLGISGNTTVYNNYTTINQTIINNITNVTNVTNNSYFNTYNEITNNTYLGSNASSLTCDGTDKFSAFNNNTGLFTCTADGGSGGNPFDQSLNTTDSPTFTDLHLQTEINNEVCSGTFTNCSAIIYEGVYSEGDCLYIGCSYDYENETCSGTTEISCADIYGCTYPEAIECSIEGGTVWENYFELNPFEEGGAYTENNLYMDSILTASNGVFGSLTSDGSEVCTAGNGLCPSGGGNTTDEIFAVCDNNTFIKTEVDPFYFSNPNNYMNSTNIQTNLPPTFTLNAGNITGVATGTAFTRYNYTTSNVITNVSTSYTNVLRLPITSGKSSEIECFLYDWANATATGVQHQVNVTGSTSYNIMIDYMTSATAKATCPASNNNVTCASGSSAGTAMIPTYINAYVVGSGDGNFLVAVKTELAGPLGWVNTTKGSWCRSIEI